MTKSMDNLVLEAINQGVQISGITPAKIAGRGVGLVATRKLKVRWLFRLCNC